MSPPLSHTLDESRPIYVSSQYLVLVSTPLTPDRTTPYPVNILDPTVTPLTPTDPNPSSRSI